MDEDDPSGKRVVEAIGSHFVEWLNRRNGGITFHMAQVLTGHGCFGEYLRRIGKEITAPLCRGRRGGGHSRPHPYGMSSLG